MSLTSLLKIKEVKKKFKEQFAMPIIKLEGELMAPPLTKHYGLVGTAFDYLMRFIIEFHNPKAIKWAWVAENALDLIRSNIQELTDIRLKKSLEKFEKYVEKNIRFAKREHDKFLRTGKTDEKLLEACIVLAQTDVIFRAGQIPNDYGLIEKKDIEDLSNLMKLIPIRQFIAEKHCFLNPTFGEASLVVGGADADIIIDNSLIDIKTTKYLTLKREYFDQLIGYYLLHRIGGITGIKDEIEIYQLGIYFSRYGLLYKLRITDVIDENTIEDFLEWFKKTAKKYFP